MRGSLVLLFFLLGCSGLIEDPAGSAGDGPRTGPDRRVEPFQPAPAVLPRLTAQQYRRSLEDLLGEGLPPTPVEADTNPHLFFTIGAASTTLSELGTQQYEEAAHRVTEHVFADAARRDALVGCAVESPGDACARSFLERFGMRAWRRPLTADELDRWVDVSATLGADDPWRGLRLAVAGILQSPSFLYRVELGEPDPDDATRRRYTSWEMASRLSYLFWNTTPDDALLAAAESGALLTEEGIHEQAMRLVEDPRARETVQQFFAQYLDLGRLENVTRDPETYPAWTTSMPIAMRTEVELLIDDLVFRREADVRELFTTRRTFVNDALAALYEVEAEGASEVLYVPVELPAAGPRAGLLTLGAFLAMNGHATETSPTLRGKYLRERVLCQEVPAPPDDVDLDLRNEMGEARTLRERLERHREDPACASCHAFIDPPGFLFEHFDSSGAYRTHESGYPVDASGDLDGVPLESASDLAELLRDDERVPGCIVRQLYRHANGRLERDHEEAALVELERAFADAGYRFKELMIELATSEAFRVVAHPEEEP